jgi:hypothetical protein
MIQSRLLILALIFTLLIGATACFRYSTTGTSIPADVNTIYIPFFPDNSSGGISNLNELLYQALVDRFTRRSRLRLADNPETADIVLDGAIQSYSNRPFSIGADQAARLNRVEVVIRASYRYTREQQPLWDRSFTGFNEYDPTANALEGESAAARAAVENLANTIFQESVGKW